MTAGIRFQRVPGSNHLVRDVLAAGSLQAFGATLAARRRRFLAMLTLNSTGAYVWEKLRQGKLVDEIVCRFLIWKAGRIKFVPVV